MSNYDCKCPICQQHFNPADDTTAEEHLIKGIIAVYADMQHKASSCDCASNLPCPRCSQSTMNDNVYRNALSRRAQIHVCDICGTQEAVEAFKGAETPLLDWYIVKEILSIKS